MVLNGVCVEYFSKSGVQYLQPHYNGKPVLELSWVKWRVFVHRDREWFDVVMSNIGHRHVDVDVTFAACRVWICAQNWSCRRHRRADCASGPCLAALGIAVIPTFPLPDALTASRAGWSWRRRRQWPSPASCLTLPTRPPLRLRCMRLVLYLITGLLTTAEVTLLFFTLHYFPTYTHIHAHAIIIASLIYTWIEFKLYKTHIIVSCMIFMSCFGVKYLNSDLNSFNIYYTLTEN